MDHFGGVPVWHASAAALPGKGGRNARDLRAVAYKHLAGVGDRAHEWCEWTGRAYHVRRRLAAAELAVVGGAVDCRGTGEGKRRLEAFRAELPAVALRMALAELAGRETARKAVGAT